MQKLYYIMILNTLSLIVYSCPDCINSRDSQAQPFFSADSYQPSPRIIPTNTQQEFIMTSSAKVGALDEE